MLNGDLPPTMFQPLCAFFGDLLLGRNAARRSVVRLTLQAAGVYMLSLATIGIGTEMGIVSPTALRVISAYDGIGAVGFYFLVRLQLEERFGSPGIPVAQISYGLVSLGIAYVLAPAIRGALCMLSPLVLIFGAFVSDPERSRMLGWLALSVFAAATGIVARQPAIEVGPSTHYIQLCFAAVLLPTTARVAALLGKLRAKTRRQNAELVVAMEKIRVLATIDELTGLPNRRQIADQLSRALADSQRRGAPLCLCMIDLDHFKQINDSHGHAAGDEVLRIVARHTVRFVRHTDFLGRWGGEEFIVLLPDTTLETAIEVIERVRNGLAMPEVWGAASRLQVTFSAGVGAHVHGESIEQLIDRIDTALYSAKFEGRGRTALAPPRLSASPISLPSRS